MATRCKEVVCRLTDIDQDIIARAADACGTTMAMYLVGSGLGAAHSIDITVPYVFAGRLFETQWFPDAWYDATSEDELVGLLKAALRRQDLATASAMAVELLDFPDSWSEIEVTEQRFRVTGGARHLADCGLVELVNATSRGAALPISASTWECYKAILRLVSRPSQLQ